MERYTFNFIKDEIQFENFTRDFVKLLYKKLNFQLYGKKGQAQYGIDGYSTEGNIYFQSKHKSKSDLKDKVLLSELNDEFKKAKSKIIESSKNQNTSFILRIDTLL